MRRFAGSFLDTAFGYAQGRRIFMPFGVFWPQYILQDRAEEQVLRRQLGYLFPLGLVPIVAMLSLFLLPRSARDGLMLPTLAAAGIGLALFVAVFVLCVVTATRRLQPAGVTASAKAPDIFDSEETAAKEVLEYLDRQETAPNRLAAIGALAGFACQMGVRAAAEAARRPSGLIEVALNDGGLRYFGDALNAPLAEATPSVWSIVSDGSPVTPLLDLFRESAAQATGEDPDGQFAKATGLLLRHWPGVAAILSEHGLLPEVWHLALARAGRRLLIARAETPRNRLTIAVMRAAILASKADPAEILVPEPRR